MKKDEIDKLLLSIDKDANCIESIPARSVVYLFKFGWLVDNVTDLKLSEQAKKRLVKVRQDLEVQTSLSEIEELISNESLEKKRPISATYIAKTLSIERKTVLSALNKLLEKGAVEKINTSNNNFGTRWAINGFNPLNQTSEVFDINNLFT